MSNCSDDLKKNGYSQEDAYFHKVNRELIDRIQKKKNQSEQKLEAKGKDPPGGKGEAGEDSGNWKKAA